MRLRLLFIVFAVLVAACGGGGDADSGSASPFTAAPTTAVENGGGTATEAPNTESPVTTESGGTDAPATTQTVERPPTEGPAAAAFTTILSDGTEFSLADEKNPVYLVFWAEW